MKASPNLLLILCLVIVAAAAGCIKIDVKTSSAGGPTPTGPTSPPGGGTSFPIVTPLPAESTVFHANDFTRNLDTDDCFRSSEGWLGYLKFQKRFEGPLSSHGPGVYPNLIDLTNLVVKTCNASNPTNVETGIVIIELSAGNPAICATNNCTLSYFGNLTILQKAMVTNTQYEAHIYVKQTNTIPATGLTIDWSYQ